MPINERDQFYTGLSNIPSPIYEKIKASLKYPSDWKVTALTDLPCGERLYQEYCACITEVTMMLMMPDISNTSAM